MSQPKSLMPKFLGLILLGACSTTGKFEKAQEIDIANLNLSGANPFEGLPELSFDSPLANKNADPAIGILFSGRVQGEIDVCGCSVNPRGGLTRRLNSARETRKTYGDGLLVLEPGNIYFPEKAGKLNSTLVEKAKLIAKTQNLMQVSALNVGFLDRKFGLDFLKKLQGEFNLPIVSTNLMDPKTQKALFETQKDFKVKETLVTVLGLTESAQGNTKATEKDFVIRNPSEALREKLQTIPQGQLTLVLADLETSTIATLANEFGKGRALVFIESRNLRELPKTTHLKSTPIFRTREGGEHWGFLELKFKSKQKLQNFPGFLSPSYLGLLSEIWTIYSDKQKLVSNQNDSNFKKKVEDFFVDVEAHYPSQISKRSFYQYANIGMSEELEWPNEVSESQKALSKK